MSKLTIIANITAQSAQLETVQAELEKLIAPTREEVGCLQYDLHQNNENPAHFVMFENWETRELWEAHLESAHFKAFVAATEGMLPALEIHQMTQIA